jgi:hypothetical protein
VPVIAKPFGADIVLATLAAAAARLSAAEGARSGGQVGV